MKSELYEDVKRSAGEFSVSIKLVEEFNELILELSSAVVKLLHGNLIDDDHKQRIIEEMWDAMCTLEQVTGDHCVHEKVGIVGEFKIERLADKLKSGDLVKGILK